MTKEDIFAATSSAEHVGDMLEFWLGMLDLAIQFPTMFEGWGPSIVNWLAGLEESIWLFSSSCQHSETVNTKKKRSRKAVIPHIEQQVVSKVLHDAGVDDLLNKCEITRMPKAPERAVGDDDCPMEVSPEEGEEEEEDDVLPPAHDTTPDPDDDGMEREEQEEDIEMEEDDEGEEGHPSVAKKRRVEVRGLMGNFDLLIEAATSASYCFECGGEHALENCDQATTNSIVDAFNLIKATTEEHSKSPTFERSQTSKKTVGRQDKLPKNAMPSGKRWRRSKVIETEEGNKILYLQPIV